MRILCVYNLVSETHLNLEMVSEIPRSLWKAQPRRLALDHGVTSFQYNMVQ